MSELATRLRSALAAAPAQPPLEGDLPEARALASIEAAVLIAITDRAEPGVILTVRREHLRTHAGQVAFPGGRVDPGEEPVAAALREAHEEIVLDPAGIEIVATIEPYRTVTGYLVTPVLGLILPDLPLEPHKHEVAEVFEVPLDYLIDPANLAALEITTVGGRPIPGGRPRRVLEFVDRGNPRNRIWGATASILFNLRERIASATAG